MLLLTFVIMQSYPVNIVLPMTLCINILASQKHGKEACRHFLCYKRWIDDTLSLVWIVLFYIIYGFLKRIHLIIRDIFFLNFSFKILFSYSRNLTILLKDSASYASIFTTITCNSYVYINIC